MKKVLSVFLSAVLILSATVFPVHAESSKAFTVSIDTVNAVQGQSSVVVPIRLQNNTGIAGFSFCVDYDKDNLVFVKAETVISSGYKVINETANDGVNIAWTDAGTYTGNGIIANLYFNIPAGAELGTASIKLKYRAGYDSFYITEGGEEKDISVESADGGVVIGEGAESDKLSLIIGTASAGMNDTDITVPISIDHITAVSGFSFCVNYDTSRLKLESAEIALPDGYKVVNYPSGYNLGLAWTAAANLDSNVTIANLHFSVKDGAVSGKAYINAVFREGYDSFYVTESGTEKDLECLIENGYVDIADHNYGGWEIIKEASCKETGLKRRTCTDEGCGHVDEVVIPKIPHDYTETVVEASCKGQGYTVHTCKNCGDSYTDNYQDQLEHQPGEWERTAEPDCVTTGTEVQKCTECHEIINTRVVAALGHSYGEWTEYTPATFHEDGESRKYCCRCSDYKTQRIPKGSEGHVHSYTGTEEIISEATYTETGSKKVYCYEPECGAYTIVTIPVIDKADEVESLIQDIGEVQYTSDSWDKIMAARNKYDALSEEEKTAVENYNSLLEAEKSFENLEKAEKSYCVLLYSKLEGTELSIANLSGGGVYYTIRGGDIQAETREGFTFVGWYTGYSAESNGTLISDQFDVHVNPKENLVLTAVYRQDPEVSFRITVSADLYTITGVSEACSAQTEFNFTAGTKVTVTYTDDSREFLYWLDSEGQILSTKKEFSFIADRDLSLTAFSLAKGSTGMQAFVVFADINGNMILGKHYTVYDTIAFPEAPAIDGKTFLRWDKDQTAIRKAMEDSETVIVKPVYE